jgi:thiol-disulfide isomerase/thioredoxin
MKKSVRSQLLAGFAAVALATTASAEEVKLKVGDPAPKLQVAKWVQGEPVKDFESGKAYIVEFWATWCGPCRVSIPHLNELHEKFKDKDLVVIGQDCWERDESLVKPFVEKMGDKMTYRVALDDKAKSEKGAMADTWMEAAGQNGIPSAFIVNKEGKIAWIGHPMSLKEQLLEDVLAGRFDIEKAAKEFAEAEKNKAVIMAASRKLNTALNKKSWDDADAAVEELDKVLPQEQRPSLGMARIQILAGKKDYAGVSKLAASLSEDNADNAMLQNQIAWTIATAPFLEKRDLKVAEKAAERGVAASKGKDANLLDTLARVQFMNGKKKEAVATQEKAVELVDGKARESFEKSLASYKADKLPQADE